MPARPNQRATSTLTRRMLGLGTAVSFAAAFAPLGVAQTSLNWSSAGTSTLGGAGSWNSAGANWWDGSAAVVWPSSGTSNVAVFGGTAGNITLDSALSANGLRFATSGYVLSGAQTLTLNGTAPFIDVIGSSTNATIGNNTTLILAGNAGLTKTGSGALTLNSSATQAFTGNVSAAAGTLTLSLANLASPTDLVPATNALVGSGGTIVATGKVGAVASQTFANTVLNKGNTQIRVGIPTGGTSMTLNLGAVTRSGPGAIVRYNTATGGFGTTASTTERLFVSGLTNGSWIAPWAFTGDHGANTLRWAYADTVTGQIRQQSGVGATAGTMANVTSPTSVYTAQGTFNLTGNASAMGLQNVNAAVYNLGVNSITLGGHISISTGVAANYSSTSSGFVRIHSGNELVTAGPGNTNINVPIVDNPGNASHVTHIGTGTLNLTGTSTYTGQTNVVGGTLVVSDTGSINSSSGVNVIGGTFRQDNFATPLSAPVSLTSGRMEGYGTADSVTVANSTSAILANRTDSPAPLTINNLVFQGTGTLAPKLGTTLVGGTPVENMPLSITNLTTNPGAGKVVIAPVAPAGGWVDGSNTYNLLTFTNWSGSLGDFEIGTASPAFAARQAATLSLAGNTIKITIAGDKALWTGGANGNWTTSAVGAPFNWRTQTGGVDTEFIANDEVVFDDTAVNTNILISSANVTVANLFINNPTKNYTISGATGLGISSVGNFIKTGAGSLTLGGTNTYSGNTTISEGTLFVGGPLAFQGNSSLVLGSNNATTTGTAVLDLNGNSARFISLTSGNSTVQTITNTGSGSGTDTLTLTKPAAAIPALITDGTSRKTAVAVGFNSGNLTNPANTFSGGLLMFGPAGGGVSTRLTPSAAANPTVVDGVISAGPYGTGSITVGVDATDKAQFYFNSSGATIANTIVVNTALGTDTPGAFRTEDHSLVVSGTVVANRASVLVHHNGQYSGGPTAGGPNPDATGGQITFSGPIIAGENPAAGFGAQQQNLSTTKRLIVTLANATPTPNSYTGNTTITAANVWLQLGAPEQIPHGAGRGHVVSSGATIDLNDFSETINGLSGSGFVENVNGQNPVTFTLGGGDANGFTYSGVIFDARGGAKLSLTKIGTGTQVLSGANQYTGNTTISAGTLQIGAGGTTGSLRTGSPIETNGTLAFNRTNTLTQGVDFAGGITGSGGLAQAGSGNVILNTVNTYAGTTTISAGTLSLSGEGTVGSGAVNLSAGTTFDVSGVTASSIALAGGLGGSGTVAATGKDVVIGGTFAPLALAITGNASIAGSATTSLVVGDSLASTSQATLTGSLLNGGALTISAGSGVTFADGQSYTFFTAGGGITSGFTSISVGAVALAPQSSGVWTGSANGLSYTYTESTATLAVANASAPLSALQTWRQQYFNSPENTGSGADNGDFDNDGLVNLMEYALGTDPTVANSSQVTVAKSGNFLTLTYTRRSPADPALAYTVQGSSDLAAGFTAATGSTAAGSPSVYTDNVDLSVAGVRRFLRLSVSYTNP